MLDWDLAKGPQRAVQGTRRRVPSRSGTVVATRTIVVSILAGVIVTLLASLRPAIKANPCSADRSGARGCDVAGRRHRAFRCRCVGRRRCALGIVLLVYGIFRDPVRSATRLLALELGDADPVHRRSAECRSVRSGRSRSVLGWPGARIGGTAGRLARENALRNPSRTASTASALMIGLALITFVAILGSGLRSSFGDAVDKLFVADYALTASNGFDPFVEAEPTTPPR